MSEHRLNEIVIERPRCGMRISLRRVRGNKKHLNQLTQEATQEGLLSPYLIKPRGKTKALSDHLGPLRRLLRSQVGQPWNDVHSKLCQRLDRNTMTGRHVLDHLWDYVEQHVELIDGVPYAKQSWGTPHPLGHYRYREQFYVHPETGILCQVERKPRKQKNTQTASETVTLDAYRQYQRLNEIWYLITFEPFPLTPAAVVRDVLQGAITRDLEEISAQADRAPSIKGRKVYAVRKQQCSKKEIRFILNQLAQR